MQIIKMKTRLSSDEKETHLNYSYTDKVWYMYSCVQKHYNKALRQGWTPITKYVYDDGSVAGYELQAPERAITIRNVEPKQMSEKQMENLLSDDDIVIEL